MEWIDRWNQAIGYIEANLTEELDIAQAARIACCSTYHFQRMFGYMAGVPLGEYVRRRRMTRAAAELQAGAKILDIALKYGYASPTAFNRAFHGVHGVPPSAAREGGVPLKSFPAISFRITVKGAEEMEYRIEKRDTIRIVGVSQPLHTQIEENFKIVPGMWQAVATDGTLQKLFALMDAEPQGVLGVSACTGLDNWRYFIAVASTKPLPEGMEEYVIPPQTWAIFAGQGESASIQTLEQRIVTEWLPTSGYEYAEGPDIEVYLNADPQNAKYEVWIPVRQADAKK